MSPLEKKKRELSGVLAAIRVLTKMKDSETVSPKERREAARDLIELKKIAKELKKEIDAGI